MMATGSPGSTYSPGSWVAVAGEGCYLIIDVEAEDSIVVRCWDLVSRGASADGLLDVIVAGGIRSAASFALLSVTDQERRVIVRGSASAVCRGIESSTQVVAASGVVWADEHVPEDLIEVTIVSDRPATSGAELPLSLGVTLAAAVQVPVESRGAETSAAHLVVPQAVRVDTPITEPPTEIVVPIERSGMAMSSDTDEIIVGPTVIATRCSNGHLTPARANRCRICQVETTAHQAFEVARPVLGRLRFSTGDVVTLDRGVVLGRGPEMPQLIDERDRPNLLRLPSPNHDLSRSHTEVYLDGWAVLVRDLGSVNGTFVTMPGEQPVRLPAHEPHPIAPGAVVSLADEVSFAFEVSA